MRTAHTQTASCFASTKRVSALSFVVTTLAGSAMLVPTASMQPAPDPVLRRFAGTYRNLLADHGNERIRTAIDGVVTQMGAMRQSLARTRLIASDPPIPRITITPLGEGLVIDYTHGRRNETPRLGTFAANRTAGGGTVEVMHEVVGNRLRETYRERRGGAVHLFDLSPDGRELAFEATIRSPHLPGPIVYALTFQRAH
jgi:hypothetical protein